MIGSQNERLPEPLRPILDRVGDVDTELAAVAQQALEIGAVLRCDDHQDVADPRQHERG